MLSLFTDFSNILKIFAVMLAAYLLGSLNIAIIVTKIFTGKDIRENHLSRESSAERYKTAIIACIYFSSERTEAHALQCLRCSALGLSMTSKTKPYSQLNTPRASKPRR